MPAPKKQRPKKQKPRPSARRNERLPATGHGGDAPHVGRAMRGCGCWLCAEHRRLDRQDRRDALEAEALKRWGGALDVLLGIAAGPELAGALFGRVR